MVLANSNDVHDNAVMRALRERPNFKRVEVYRAYVAEGFGHRKAMRATDKLLCRLRDSGNVVYEGHATGWRFVR